MEATNLDRYGCTVGERRITYGQLKSYVCNDCGGRAVHGFTYDPDTGETVDRVNCGTCGGTDIIHEMTFAQQQAEADEVLTGLPPMLRALIAPEMEGVRCHSRTEAIADLFD